MKCESYLRFPAFRLLQYCRNKAKYVFIDKSGKKKYLCGKHIKQYPKHMIRKLTKEDLLNGN